MRRTGNTQPGYFAAETSEHHRNLADIFLTVSTSKANEKIFLVASRNTSK